MSVREIRHPSHINEIKRHGRSIEWRRTIEELLEQLGNDERLFAMITYATFEYTHTINCLEEFWHAALSHGGGRLSGLFAVPRSHDPTLQS